MKMMAKNVHSVHILATALSAPTMEATMGNAGHTIITALTAPTTMGRKVSVSSVHRVTALIVHVITTRRVDSSALMAIVHSAPTVTALIVHAIIRMATVKAVQVDSVVR